ncbi:hypothetical protein ACTXT7_016978 [Hymenolepis weldensis]
MEFKPTKPVRVMDFSEFMDYVKEHGDEFEKLRSSPPSGTIVRKRTTLPTKRPTSDNLHGKQKRSKSHGDGKNATLDAFVIKIQSDSNRVSSENEENDIKASLERKSTAPMAEKVENNKSPKMETPVTASKSSNVENPGKEVPIKSSQQGSLVVIL